MKGKINGYLFEAYENEKVVLNVVVDKKKYAK